ncbi:hypothetical protein [Thermoleptolyngbya sp. PKUAC-SCTB121]|uniref:hypothetical protein n=1 Tax=Thermoleptolyngbya sp. PKUAC-SCTB121 TaxID=2811482 RepID=UPI001964AD71|nr:hypothetical protein [Thermoleptolyngbya sp. PKUAC-SCTB121]
MVWSSLCCGLVKKEEQVSFVERLVTKWMTVGDRLRQAAAQRPVAATSLAIFWACVFVYTMNGRVDLNSSDNVTNTLLGFNWLQNHSLNFDAFRDGYLYRGGGIPFYFVESSTGHLSSRFPIGSALVTFPLAVLYYFALKLAAFLDGITGGVFNLFPAGFPDVASEDFAAYRQGFSKFAATISTALTVVFFYLSTRLKFSPSVAAVSTFVFAFATGIWPICSQDLRQHTISNLLLSGILLCLLKVEHGEGKNRRLLLFLAGFFCGILPSARITSALFSAVIFLYVVIAYRKEAVFFLLGLPSVLFHLGWNLYYFGWGNLIVGGYISYIEKHPSSYSWTFEQFRRGSLGLLLSPSNGILVFSPVLLFAIPGAYRLLQRWKRENRRDEWLLLCLMVSVFLLYLQYSFYLIWLGGNDSFGPRFLADTLPISCFLIAYFLADLAPKLRRNWQGARFVLALFLISLILSTLIQTIGAFTQTNWKASPMPATERNGRLWALQDSKIERHTRNLLAKFNKPIRDRKTYLAGFQGTAESLHWIELDGDEVPVGDRPRVRSGQRRLLKLALRNTGTSPWFGYQTGIEKMGEAKIRLRFYDAKGKDKTPRIGNQLFVSGRTQPGGATIAIGQAAFPAEPGVYQLECWLVADGISSLNPESAPTYVQTITVLPRSSPAQPDSPSP